jgi:hypothetical protein
MDDDAVLVHSVAQVAACHVPIGEDLRFRPVSNWEARARELATALRRSNRSLWEVQETLAELQCRPREEAIADDLRQRHAQELSTVRTRVAGLEGQLREQDEAWRVKLEALQAVHATLWKNEADRHALLMQEAMGRLQRQERDAEERLQRQEREAEERMAKQKEEKDLAQTAQVVELVAQLKEADERRRREKRELADGFKGQIAEARNAVEAFRKERDADRQSWAETHRDIEEMQRQAVAQEEQARKETETLRAEMAEQRKQAGKKQNAKHAKLIKDHQELLLLHKRTMEAARELRVEVGQVEQQKRAAQRELEDREKLYVQLEKIHERSTFALTEAREELLAVQARLKEEVDASAKLCDGTQMEMTALRDMLIKQTVEINGLQDENQTLRQAVYGTEKGMLMVALHDRTQEVVTAYRKEVERLNALLAQGPAQEALQKEVAALREMVKTSNAELQSAKHEAQIARNAFGQTEQGKLLEKRQREVDVLQRVVTALIADINDEARVDKLLGSLKNYGMPRATVQALETAAARTSKKAKK